jgi:Uma2 family endonuclease
MTPTAPAGLMTAEEFYDWASRPENADRKWELDEGVPVEVEEPDVPPPGDTHGLLIWFILTRLTDYVRGRRAGHLYPNDTGLIVRRRPDTVRGPDLMLFLDSRTFEQSVPGYVERVPALVVEVVSPSDKASKLRRRVAQYLKRGVPLVWVVYPEERAVSAHRPGQPTVDLEWDDDLSALDVLPGFACTVAGLFALPGTAPPAGTI